MLYIYILLILAQFHSYFEQYGEILSSEVLFRKEQDTYSGFGMVVYKSEISASTACKYKHSLDGVVVIEAKLFSPGSVPQMPPAPINLKPMNNLRNDGYGTVSSNSYRSNASNNSMRSAPSPQASAYVPNVHAFSFNGSSTTMYIPKATPINSMGGNPPNASSYYPSPVVSPTAASSASNSHRIDMYSEQSLSESLMPGGGQLMPVMGQQYANSDDTYPNTHAGDVIPDNYLKFTSTDYDNYEYLANPMDATTNTSNTNALNNYTNANNDISTSYSSYSSASATDLA